MNLLLAEKFLTVGYSIITALGAISSITCGIAWGHWRATVDKCAFTNCTCILYGVNTPTHFLGGNAASCIWVTYGPLLYVIICISMACFHGFRVLFSSKKVITRTVTAKNEFGETIELHAAQGESTNPLPKCFWYIMSGITIFCTIYTLIHFSIYIDGYLSSCKQYRLTLEKLLNIHGTLIPVIETRLSCNAVFDFMDYMQLDSGNAYRDGFINTGVDLTIGIVASFFSWVLFLFISITNIKFSRFKE